MRTGYQFKSCLVVADDESGTVVVSFESGPQYADTLDDVAHWNARVAQLGYSIRPTHSTRFRCMLDYVLFHIVMAEMSGLDYSPALHARANSIDENASVLFRLSDSLVADLQLLFNGGKKPNLDLRTFAKVAGVSVGTLRHEFMKRIEQAKELHAD